MRTIKKDYKRAFHYTVIFLFFFSAIGINTFAAEWYFRPKQGGPYGDSSGTSYENVWHLAEYTYPEAGAVNL
jgi:hypothetical protein